MYHNLLGCEMKFALQAQPKRLWYILIICKCTEIFSLQKLIFVLKIN